MSTLSVSLVTVSASGQYSRRMGAAKMFRPLDLLKKHIHCPFAFWFGLHHRLVRVDIHANAANQYAGPTSSSAGIMTFGRSSVRFIDGLYVLSGLSPLPDARTKAL